MNNLNPTKEEYQKMVSDLVYRTLSSAGELCRIRCFSPDENSDPNLLDSIADGIYRFLSDGDIFDQVMDTLVERDPEYIGRSLGRQDEAVWRTIVSVAVSDD